MEKPKWLIQLEDELEEQRKYRQKHDKTTLLDGIFIIFSLGLPLLFFIKDPQVYFYKNYFVYALVGFILQCLIFLYLFPKLFDLSKLFSGWYTFSAIVLGIALNFYIFPRIAHAFFLDKQTVCMETKLVSKRWDNRNDYGLIHFDLTFKPGMPMEYYQLTKKTSLSGFDREKFDSLPSKGTPIKICGELSEVAFGYTDILERKP